MQRSVKQQVVGVLVGAFLLGCPSLYAQNRKPTFVTVGEGYTAARASQGIRVEWHAFTGSDFAVLCGAPAVKATTRLLARQQTMKVAVDEFFSFSGLKVIAVDATGLSIGPVPITLAVEESAPPWADLKAYKLTGKNVRALRPGTFRVRIRTLCGGAGGRDREVGLRYVVRGN